MCGITGIVAFNEIGRFNMTNLESATQALSNRGPDDHGTYDNYFTGLGHRRLAILDTSQMGHQPMQLPEGHHVITFNGEIYNYRELRKELEAKGVQFYSQTDTEVLLQLYIHEGKDCLKKLNGFFAFAIYDSQSKSTFIARDRLGIKPLLYYQDEDKFLFSSELKSLMKYSADWEIDSTALNIYFQLNYIPAPLCILKGVKKLMPGQSVTIQNGDVAFEQYYDLPNDSQYEGTNSYAQNQQKLIDLLDESVQKRLVSDVPLGAFLSGGIDSSVISALASQHTDSLNTFSIGYKDAPYFDETYYAQKVADKFRTNHTVFSLNMDDLYSDLDEITDYIDEPFADSSAIPVYILSKKARKHVKVALSGDGADEIFSGYNKHSAWIKSEQGGLANQLVPLLYPVAKSLPKSRSGKLSNFMRQVVKFSEGIKMNPAERYWFWAAISKQAEVNDLLSEPLNNVDERNQQIESWLQDMISYKNFNDFLRTDTRLVLPNDMLQKVDLMSMANSLEVRVPFLDHNIVDFAFGLPPNQKIDTGMRKKILQDAFRHILPKELYKRPKKGFEVPLLDWLKKGIKPELERLVFDWDYITSQSIFNPIAIDTMKKQLFSMNPGDIHAKIWAIYVFQKWHEKFMS
ncbi:MAG: asparagine synthase (glutamine-hydrolyzing) [Cyclobacteriaceae bacterium]